MNYYETLYIVHPALESGRLKDIISGIEDSLKKLGGKLLAVELWGKRKLSFYIDKQKYGTYVLIQYNGEGKCTNSLAIELEHNPNVLSYLTTSISSDEVLEMKEDLDTQIAGKTRDTEKSESNHSEKKELEKENTDANASQIKDSGSKEDVAEEIAEKVTEEIIEDSKSETSNDESNNETTKKETVENIED